VVTGVGVQLKISRQYIDCPLKTSLKNEHKKWFYMGNRTSKIVDFLSQRLAQRLEWMSNPTPKYIDVMLVVTKRVVYIKPLGL
jgi:hypothetical protein